MLVKSPLKKKRTTQNRRKKQSAKRAAQPKAATSKNGYGQRVKTSSRKFTLPAVAPWKVVLGIIGLGVIGLAYLNHVFATQKMLTEVQQMEQQYNKALRSHNHYRLMYDRMTGPADISAKAKDLGLINGGPAEKIIEVPRP